MFLQEQPLAGQNKQPRMPSGPAPSPLETPTVHTIQIVCTADTNNVSTDLIAMTHMKP